jgi:hypothetical protein
MKTKANITPQNQQQILQKRQNDKIEEILNLVRELVSEKENISSNNNQIQQGGVGHNLSINNSRIPSSSNNNSSTNNVLLHLKNTLNKLVEEPKIKQQPVPNPNPQPLPSRSLIGLANKEYFAAKYRMNNANANINNITTNIYKRNDFSFQRVISDGNCGYRALALQLFGNEEFHSDVRNQIYTYLALNKGIIPEQNFEINDIILTNEQYIQYVKNNGFFMGDLELAVINIIYNATLIIFQLRENEEDINLLNIKGNLFDPNTILLTLCIVNDDHFCAIYEKGRPEQNVVNKIYGSNTLRFIDNRIMMNVSRNDNAKIEIEYINDNKIFKYRDIVNYLNSRVTNKPSDGVYPLIVSNIQDRIQRRNKKREFRKALKNYFIDPTTKRLKLKFVDSTTLPKVTNDYFIAYQIEKVRYVKKVHDLQMHKGIKSLYELVVKKNHYWWVGIYQDIKAYGTYCDICKHTVRVVKRGRPRKNKDNDKDKIK